MLGSQRSQNLNLIKMIQTGKENFSRNISLSLVHLCTDFKILYLIHSFLK